VEVSKRVLDVFGEMKGEEDGEMALVLKKLPPAFR
jgi:hypothetical protein